MTRVTTDVENLNEMFTQGLVAVFGDIVSAVGIVIVAFTFLPRFLRAVASGLLEETARVALDRLPLPNVLGRVCFHPCEDDCRRQELGGALSVCRLRRQVFDTLGELAPPWPSQPSSGKRVAVIGAGPAGLGAAIEAADAGLGVFLVDDKESLGGKLLLQVGFCDPAELAVPKGVKVKIEVAATKGDETPARFSVFSIDNFVLGQFASSVRQVRPPEPYKGKGIRFTGEHVKRKVGKAFTSGAAAG